MFLVVLVPNRAPQFRYRVLAPPPDLQQGDTREFEEQEQLIVPAIGFRNTPALNTNRFTDTILLQQQQQLSQLDRDLALLHRDKSIETLNTVTHSLLIALPFYSIPTSSVVGIFLNEEMSNTIDKTKAANTLASEGKKKSKKIFVIFVVVCFFCFVCKCRIICLYYINIGILSILLLLLF